MNKILMVIIELQCYVISFNGCCLSAVKLGCMAKSPSYWFHHLLSSEQLMML